MRRILSILTLFLLVSSCQKQDIFDTLNDDNGYPTQVRFMLSDWGQNIATRGIPREGAGFTDHNGTSFAGLDIYNTAKVHVAVYAYDQSENWADIPDNSFYFQTKLTNASGDYTAPDWGFAAGEVQNRFYPAGKKLAFFSWASDLDDIPTSGSTANDNGLSLTSPSDGVPTLTYNVPQDVEKHPDLLVAMVTDKNSGRVTLPMKHALSCISFVATSVKSSATSPRHIKSIVLKGVYGSGILSLDTNLADHTSWTTQGPQTVQFIPGIDPDVDLESSLGSTPDELRYLMNGNGYLMMIPQVVDAAELEVVFTDGTTDDPAITLPLPALTWQPGKKYIYYLDEASEEIVVYYEKYSDASIGLFYGNGDARNSIKNDTELSALTISEAGYGVLTKSTTVGTSSTITLGSAGVAEATTSDAVMIDADYTLYPVSQTSISSGEVFDLSAITSLTPIDVYFDGNGVPCGKIIPHFAKGVYSSEQTSHSIRTPQQMLNISYLTAQALNLTTDCTFEQDLNLDFSTQNANIGGGDLTIAAVVTGVFNGTYNADPQNTQNNAKVISNVNISTTSNNVGLFSENRGTIKYIQLTTSTIKGGNNVGGIAGVNIALIKHPQIKGTESAAPLTITGVTNVGGIVGNNLGGRIEGKTEQGVSIPDVLGNVTITGTGGSAGATSYLDDTNVGGIAGRNERGTLSDVNVRGNYDTNDDMLTITSPNGSNVGGIVGWNYDGVIGGAGSSFTSTRGNVEIIGVNRVGGIVGRNSGSGSGTALQYCYVYDYSDGTRQFSPTITATNAQIGSLQGIAGGIAGYNTGSITHCAVWSNNDGVTVKIESAGEYAGGILGYNAPLPGGFAEEVTFCGVYGKVEIRAENYSGGIVGGHQTGAKGSNCWIGNSDTNLIGVINHAITYLGLPINASIEAVNTNTIKTPWVTGSSYIGGIVGLNSGTIENITMNDNVKVGAADFSLWVQFVGGLVGGNAPYTQANGGGQIINCTVKNEINKIVTIRGSASIGGIAGLSNGLIDNCHIVGGNTAATRLTIYGGNSQIGGIAGQNGGNAYGSNETKITGCTVNGYVTISATNFEPKFVGGIAGQNGATNKITDCQVGNMDGSDIIISAENYAGGIVGVNDSDVQDCHVRYATITATKNTAGGIAGTINNAVTVHDNGNLNNCHVGYNSLSVNGFVTVTGTTSGGLVGSLFSGTGSTGFGTNNNVRSSSVTVGGAAASSGNNVGDPGGNTIGCTNN